MKETLHPHLPVLVIGGPTASGKSAFALELAQALNGTIIAADSVQVYRGFDIGSAKPSAAEQALVPHRCIDLLEPTATGHAGSWVRAADEAIAEAHASGRVPLVVGGTGLYIRSLLHGLSETPEAPPELRQRLSHEWQTLGAEAMHSRLAAVDSEAARRIHANDSVRVIRALEVFEHTGTPLSAQQQAHGFRPARYRYLLWVLDRDRDVLRQRVHRRAQAMLDAGLVDEVRGLLGQGVPPTCTPMQAIGYREVVDALQGALPFAEVATRIGHATAQYAKRQRTWFRAESDAVWLDASGVEADFAASVAAAATFFSLNTPA
jgi:tRNA dimethylallyltransferase